MSAQNAYYLKTGAEVIVRVPTSHRRRERFERALGRKPQYLYSLRFAGNFARLQRSEYSQIKLDKADRHHSRSGRYV